MDKSDLEFVAETLLLTVESGDQDGLQIMFDWGTEIMDGDPNSFLETIRKLLEEKGKSQAISILEDHVNILSGK